MSEQQVLCLPRVCSSDRPGFTPWDAADWLHDSADADMTWIPRAAAERSDDLVQPIPCAVIRGLAGGYYVFRRIRKGRVDLQAKISMIVGGHIDWEPGNLGFAELVQMTLLREIREELEAEEPEGTEPIGIVVDDASLQSSRHIGIIHEVVLDGTVRPIAAEEFSRHSRYAGLLCSESELKALIKQMDPWSSIVFYEHIAPMSGIEYQPRLL